MSGQIAALYVETGGSYFSLPGVDPWDEARDARQYRGPYPIVGHPPCQRWGKLWAGQPLFIKRTGIRKKKGDDGGCFEACLSAAREFGGIIEHPWGSHAWPHFGLNTPSRSGGWIVADFHGGWTCCVEQGRYGHYARKPTLLLVYGVDPADLPELDWGIGEPRLDPEIVARMGLKRAKRLGEVGGKGGGKDSTPRIGTPAPAATCCYRSRAPLNRKGQQHDPSDPLRDCNKRAFAAIRLPTRVRGCGDGPSCPLASVQPFAPHRSRIMSAELTSLIERVEGAGEVETRALLSEAFDLIHQRQLPSRPGTVTWNPLYLRFTTFLGANAWLDAATLLIPEDHDYCIERVNDEHWASVSAPGERTPIVAGKSAALATVAAALRARLGGAA